MSLKSVLVIEDNPGDIKLIKMVFHAMDMHCKLTIFETGHEALKFLCEHSDNLPNFILIDQNLPGMSGFEIIREIRLNPAYDFINIAMFSSARAPYESIEYWPDIYVIKPFHFDEYKTALLELFEKWSSMSKEM
jgi:CheY-like chemotaxis protein